MKKFKSKLIYFNYLLIIFSSYIIVKHSFDKNKLFQYKYWLLYRNHRLWISLKNGDNQCFMDCEKKSVTELRI